MQQDTVITCSVSSLVHGEVAEGNLVRVQGWVRTKRDSKAGLSFIALDDGSGFAALQVVAPKTLSNYETEVLQLTPGCSLIAEGVLVESPGQGQAYELQAQKIQVVGLVDNPDTYPITPKYHTLEYLREYPYLRVRTRLIGAVMRVRNVISQAIHRFFSERGFYWVHTPLITASDCEGAGEMFRVTTLDLDNLPRDAVGKVDFAQDFFARETFLTVSGQLNVEAYCEALGRVYTFGPTFRAENSNTGRHLAEFWMVEPEIAFADLKQDAELATKLLVYLAETVLNEAADDLKFFAEKVDPECIQRLEQLVKSNFVTMEYSEAIEHLLAAKKKFEFPVSWGIDLQSEHERYLTEEVAKAPVILINYPQAIKSFYMRLNPDGRTVAAMDILVPGVGEIMGGSQREERYEVLRARMEELKMNLDAYQWYLDLRRYGSVPHAGFGLGLERIIMYFTGIANIRDVIPFPRFPKHADF